MLFTYFLYIIVFQVAVVQSNKMQCSQSCKNGAACKKMTSHPSGCCDKHRSQPHVYSSAMDDEINQNDIYNAQHINRGGRINQLIQLVGNFDAAEHGRNEFMLFAAQVQELKQLMVNVPEPHVRFFQQRIVDNEGNVYHDMRRQQAALLQQPNQADKKVAVELLVDISADFIAVMDANQLWDH